MKVVTVKFESRASSSYSYLVPTGDNPKVGDVVVTSLSAEQNWQAGYSMSFKMARVMEVHEDDSKATKFYVHLLPVQDIRARLVEDAKALADVRRKRAIKNQLNNMLQERMDFERFKVLESDPEAALLIEELKELENGV